jgi:hypothetical protein
MTALQWFWGCLSGKRRDQLVGGRCVRGKDERVESGWRGAMKGACRPSELYGAARGVESEEKVKVGTRETTTALAPSPLTAAPQTTA